MVGDLFVLRSMVEADAPAVARIGFEAWVQHRFHPEWFDPVVERRVEASFRTFAADPQADVVVCQVGDVVVGWGARDSRTQAGDPSVAWDYVSDLWIRPSSQGRGIGSAVLADLIARMRLEAIQKVSIEVVEANGRAFALYRKHGFAETWRGVRNSQTLGLPVRRILLERAIA